MAQLSESDDGVQFSHTLEEQIGGQLAAGLILTDAVKARIAAVKGGGGGTVEVASGLVVGDKVLMLRVSSGQCYIILSRL